MHNKFLKNVFATLFIIIILIIVFIPDMRSSFVQIKNTNISINDTIIDKIEQVSLDYDLIRNITENLSNIIITEYNETNGEIAKGRAFGSKGEQKTADILDENFSDFGFIPDREYLHEKFVGGFLERKIEVLDYQLSIYYDASKTNCTVFTLPRRSMFGPHNQFWKLNHNFSYRDLRIRKSHPSREEDTEKYVIFKRDGIDDTRVQPNGLFTGWPEKILEFFLHPNWVGFIRADSNNETCDMWIPGKFVPIFSINKTVGDSIDIENDRISFYLNQRVNNSVKSCNVIGEIKGKNPHKTVIVSCLYDSWWCQGAGDSAVGMGIVMGIAKYFKELETIYGIRPDYTMKFIGFCGEEVGCRGAQYYVRTHPFERILYMIDLNQLGMDQTDPDPRLTLEVLANNVTFLDCVWNVVNRTDYMRRTDFKYNITKLYRAEGHLSNDRIFATQRPLCKTVCFLKGGRWKYHHRDGLNHTEGDVLDHIDWNDVNVTAEIVLNVTKSLVLGQYQDKFQSMIYNIDLFSSFNQFLSKERKIGL